MTNQNFDSYGSKILQIMIQSRPISLKKIFEAYVINLVIEQRYH